MKKETGIKEYSKEYSLNKKNNNSAKAANAKDLDSADIIITKTAMDFLNSKELNLKKQGFSEQFLKDSKRFNEVFKDYL